MNGLERKDTVEARDADKVLGEARDELEARVRERTDEHTEANADLQEQIKERKQIAEVLEESQERFELAMRGTNEGIWDWNVRTNETYFSPRWKSILGYEDHEIGDGLDEWEKRLHPDDRERAMAAVRAYFEGDAPSYELKHRLLHKDGTYRWILARGFALRDESGVPYRMAGSHLDITDHKRAEEALHKNNVVIQLLRGAATASNEALSFEEAMQKCLELMRVHIGWPMGHVYIVSESPTSELLSTSIWYLDNHERFEAFMKATEDTRFSLGVELSGRVLASGEPVWISDVSEDPSFSRIKQAVDTGIRAGFAFPVLVRDEVVAIVEFFATEALEPDEQLLEILLQVGTQLGHVVERERAKEKLNQLNEEFEIRNLELDQKTKENEAFVYSVSHDLRSPLVNLEGFSQELALVGQEVREILEDSDVPPETRRQGLSLLDEDMTISIRFIQAGVKRLSNIIDALLRFSRVGRVEYRWQQVHLNSVIGGIIDAMSDTIAERGANVAAGDLPPAWGDSTQLEQVFANLLSNALNYLDPERPGLIEVGFREPKAASDDEEKRKFHTYYVKDNGLGIPEPALDKIFQVFQRLHPEKAVGEGMGLTLVQRVVERHGGKIWAESIEGEGSTFFVRLPSERGRQR
jgi:PAS domain S-box-containing protein